MTTITSKRNDLRTALINFYSFLIAMLTESHKETKLKDLKRNLINASNDIKKQYRQSPYKHVIKKALKGEVRNTLSLAQEVLEGNRFQNGKLMYNIFDGIPLNASVQDRAYDIVVKLDPYRSKALVFAPSKEDHGFDTIQAQIDAERDFNVPCIKVDIHYPFPQNALNEALGSIISHAESTRVEQTRSLEEQKENMVTKNNNTLGKVLFSNKDQFNLRAEQTRDEIKGLLKKKDARKRSMP